MAQCFAKAFKGILDKEPMNIGGWGAVNSLFNFQISNHIFMSLEFLKSTGIGYK